MCVCVWLWCCCGCYYCYLLLFLVVAKCCCCVKLVSARFKTKTERIYKKKSHHIIKKAYTLWKCYKYNKERRIEDRTSKLFFCFCFCFAHLFVVVVMSMWLLHHIYIIILKQYLMWRCVLTSVMNALLDYCKVRNLWECYKYWYGYISRLFSGSHSLSLFFRIFFSVFHPKRIPVWPRLFLYCFLFASFVFF